MSVQLIVYPQNYEGEYNAISNSPYEVVVNGINFTALDTTTSYDSSVYPAYQTTLLNEPPNIPNTWYRFRSIQSGTPDLPVVTSGNLVLNSTTTQTMVGVYQRLTNFYIGPQYTITINIATPASSGSLYAQVFNGDTMALITQNGVSAALTSLTLTFYPQTASDIVLISYFNSVSDNVTIENISIQPSYVSPNLTNFELEDGQIICDLYEDEDIPLSLSVDDFKNVAEKVQSYSKAFKLPATKRNNRIFDNMFEVTRTDDGIIFNPYNRTECVLKQDGFILFKGYLKMIDINDKDGEISYNVNLYSEVVTLADILKDRTFSQLDFTELEHDYTVTQVQNSWDDGSGTGIAYSNPSTSGFRQTYGTLCYPFVDWNHQYTTDTNGLILPNLESTFRPFINIKYLINRIFAETPFTWESTLFDSDDFGKLYMDFNWGADNAPVEIEATTILSMWVFWSGYVSSYAGVSYGVMFLSINIPFIGGITPPNYNDTTQVITSTVTNETYNIDYRYTIENTDTVDRTIECRWLYNSTEREYSGIQTIAANGGLYDYTGNFTEVMQTIGDTLQVQFRTNAGTASKVRQHETPFNLTGTLGAYVTFTLSAEAITNATLLHTLRGELKQWEFLKGIMTMFNLVSLPDEDNPNNIKFEPYADVFISDTNSSDINNMTLAARSIQHDWTDRIDVAEMKLQPLTDLNKNTIFKFVEDDDDYPFTNYKKQVQPLIPSTDSGHLYGSLKYDASLASNGLATVLEGTDEIVAEPFAATVIKPIMPQFPALITPAIYAMSDNESEAFDNSPRIMYNNGKKPTGIDCFVQAQNGSSAIYLTEFLQFSHLTDIPTVASLPPAVTDTNDFHFGVCQLLPPIGAATPRNLFSLYWSPYYNELYHPDTRIMTIKVNLSPSIINTFKFNDTVMIKNRVFRVNKIDYKPNDLATVEFILIP